MRTLVVGGTGTVGSEVTRRLLERGLEVLVPSRSDERLAELPDGADGVLADLEDPSTYDALFHGADRMFLLNPVSLSELHQGLAALVEARRAGVERVVHLSVHDLDSWEEGALRMMPAWMVYDFRLMFELFQEDGLIASRAEKRETLDILGREPRSFEEFTRETAAAWRRSI